MKLYESPCRYVLIDSIADFFLNFNSFNTIKFVSMTPFKRLNKCVIIVLVFCVNFLENIEQFEIPVILNVERNFSLIN
jgi:hypothetical protein